MKKDSKHNTFAVINNYKSYDRETNGHGDSMTDKAHKADFVKINLAVPGLWTPKLLKAMVFMTPLHRDIHPCYSIPYKDK